MCSRSQFFTRHCLDACAAALIDRGKAPANWAFDPAEFWVEEHGLIMEKPDFPLPPGRYVVTGGRETTTVLTVAEDGDAWLTTLIFDLCPVPFFLKMGSPKP